VALVAYALESSSLVYKVAKINIMIAHKFLRDTQYSRSVSFHSSTLESKVIKSYRSDDIVITECLCMIGVQRHQLTSRQPHTRQI